MPKGFYQYLKPGNQVDEARLFLVVPSNRKKKKKKKKGGGSNRHKVGHKKFNTNMSKNFFTVRVTEHWNRCPRAVVDSPYLEIFRTHLDAFLCNLL